jgi:G:T-mismatch repair DNA endonuclease (very short patch repair protein)
MTMADAFQRTIDRRAHIESKGYKVIEKWECDLNRELNANIAMKDFFDGKEIMSALDGREGKIYSYIFAIFFCFV